VVNQYSRNLFRDFGFDLTRATLGALRDARLGALKLLSQENANFSRTFRIDAEYAPASGGYGETTSQFPVRLHKHAPA
jgi:hypothetical protein